MPTTLTYRGHSDNIFALAWSPDSQYLASASRDKTVQVWNPITAEPHLIYRGHSSCLLSVAWSPDGNYIASGDTDGIVQIWEALTGKHILSYHGHTRFVRSIAWSPDGEYIASGGDYGDSTVQVWQAFTGIHIYTHTNQYRIFAVTWSPNGEHVASASFDGTVQVWTAPLMGALPEQDNLFTYHGHIGPVYAIAWSPTRLAAARAHPPYHASPCHYISVGSTTTYATNPSNGAYIASAGHDSTVHVWHAGDTQHSQGELLHIYRGHTLPVKTLAWSSDSQYIASGGNDKTLRIWESTTGQLVTTYDEHANWIRTIAWSPDRNYIASASDHTVHILHWHPPFPQCPT